MWNFGCWTNEFYIFNPFGARSLPPKQAHLTPALWAPPWPTWPSWRPKTWRLERPMESRRGCPTAVDFEEFQRDFPCSAFGWMCCTCREFCLGTKKGGKMWPSPGNGLKPRTLLLWKQRDEKNEAIWQHARYPRDVIESTDSNTINASHPILDKDQKKNLAFNNIQELWCDDGLCVCVICSYLGWRSKIQSHSTEKNK